MLVDLKISKIQVCPPPDELSTNQKIDATFELRTQSSHLSRRNDSQSKVKLSIPDKDTKANNNSKYNMARSEEAILRRALKRQRTEEEQRKADRKDMEQAKLRKALQEEQEKRSSARKKEFKKSLKGSPVLATTERKAVQAPTPVSPRKSATTTTKTTSTSSKDTDRPKPPPLTNETDDRMKEEGAWKCPSCGNENFASRNWCNSKTCNERRPGNVNAPPPFSSQRQKTPSENYRQRSLMTEPGAWDCPSCGFQNYASRDVCFNRSCRQGRPCSNGGINNSSSSKPSPSSSTNKRQRHDPETSKQLVWSKQADATTLSKNQELRERYRTTGGEGMTEEEIGRAKILVARDERKRQKKKEKVSTPGYGSGEATGNDKKEVASLQNDAPPTCATPSVTTPSSNKSKKENDAKRKSKSQKDKNKVLLERYKETRGKGMKEAEVERAKTLLARAQRKQQKAGESRRVGKAASK